MKVLMIAGLCNPGEEYSLTRHNAGAEYVSQLCHKHALSLKKEKQINGSIRIVKQGDLAGDHASICLQPDGTIQISGSRIYLGRVPDNEHRPGAGETNVLQLAPDAGRGGGPDGTKSGSGRLEYMTEKGSNPMVRYQQLENLLNAMCDTLNQCGATLKTNQTPGFGRNCTQVTNAGDILTTGAANARAMITGLASERVFTE